MAQPKASKELQEVLKNYPIEVIFKTLMEMHNEFGMRLGNKIYYMVQQEKDVELVKDWMDMRNVEIDDVEDFADEYRELVNTSLDEDLDTYLYACLQLH